MWALLRKSYINNVAIGFDNFAFPRPLRLSLLVSMVYEFWWPTTVFSNSNSVGQIHQSQPSIYYHLKYFRNLFVILSDHWIIIRLYSIGESMMLIAHAHALLPWSVSFGQSCAEATTTTRVEKTCLSQLIYSLKKRVQPRLFLLVEGYHHHEGLNIDFHGYRGLLDNDSHVQFQHTSLKQLCCVLGV